MYNGQITVKARTVTLSPSSFTAITSVCACSGQCGETIFFFHQLLVNRSMQLTRLVLDEKQLLGVPRSRTGSWGLYHFAARRVVALKGTRDLLSQTGQL